MRSPTRHGAAGTGRALDNTSYESPYEDRETEAGFIYAFRAGNVDQPANRSVRAAFELQVPLVHFVGTRPGWYRPTYPCFIEHNDPVARRVLFGPGK